MENKYFIVTITGITKEGNQGHVKSFLSGLMAKSRKEEGCVQYDIYQSTENPREFLLFTVWDNQESFDRHNQTPLMQEFKNHLAKEFFVHESRKNYWTLLGEGS